MAMGSFRTRYQPEPVAEINIVPMVDVMLVLLVIFIVTAPLLTHAVKIDLPKVASHPNVARAEHIEFALRDDGEAYWNGARLEWAEVEPRLAAAANQQPQPELHLRVDRRVPYEQVARVMAAAARTGLTRIGFVSDPTEKR
ncbi:MAG: biopolymer transporter ExbD [Hydrogenophilales bacterium]|nr:biopolymer transporter ExbD [Hydrogenophilales bacterium]